MLQQAALPQSTQGMPDSCNWTVFMSNSRKRNERTRPYYRERNGPISSIGSTGLAVSSIGLLYRWVHLWLKGEDLSTLLLIPFGSLCPSKSSHSPTLYFKEGTCPTTASSWA
ncbi:hypothetical protein L1987_88552 [Smallanthus sonchifolius]|nr:hypothetical protein L1987_88552 [Smallanthus sonchifolius]